MSDIGFYRTVRLFAIGAVCISALAGGSVYAEIAGDLNQDGKVDYEDVAILSWEWLCENTGVSPDEPVAWWKFDETEGSVAYDSTGNHFPAVVVGQADGIWDPDGIIDGCMYFQGSHALYADPEAFTAVAISSEVTISMWVYYETEATSRGFLFQAGWPGAFDEVFSCRSASFSETTNEPHRFVVGRIQNDDDTEAMDELYCSCSSPTNFLNRWMHICVTRDSSGLIRVYHDGKPAASKDNANYPLGGIVNFSIGGNAYTGWTRFSSGKIDDFRIYDYALSRIEIMSLVYQATSGSSEPYTLKSDIVEDGKIDFKDFAALASELQP